MGEHSDFIPFHFTTFTEKIPLFWRRFFSAFPIRSPAARMGMAGGQVIFVSAAIRPSLSERGTSSHGEKAASRRVSAGAGAGQLPSYGRGGFRGSFKRVASSLERCPSGVWGDSIRTIFPPPAYSGSIYSLLRRAAASSWVQPMANASKVSFAGSVTPGRRETLFSERRQRSRKDRSDSLANSSFAGPER